MSKPILSRPRTRVYGCNYDKGESYYKPMVEHLDRKYSARPLFPEPRTSFADEIAARRSDIGSRSLSGAMSELLDDDLETTWSSSYCKKIPEEEGDEDFVGAQRRIQRRASDTFEEDLADLRRRRRDLQDRLFDMVDIGAEIQRAKTTLAGAKEAFDKHAPKFDNKEAPEEEPTTLIGRLEKTRKQIKETSDQEAAQETRPLMKWSKYMEMRDDMPKPRVRRLDSPLGPIDIAPAVAAPVEVIVNKPEKKRKKRTLLKRKKSAAVAV